MRVGWFVAGLALIWLVGCQATAPATPQPPPPATSAAAPSSTTPPTATMMPDPTPTLPPNPDQALANADVLFVRAVQAGDGSWTFHVTVEHPDTGWDDYADGWDVVLPDGQVVKPATAPFTRLLLHPHENEQPFTRSQSGLVLPSDVTAVTVRAHDIVDGFGGRTVSLDLSIAEGPDFTVER
jgi:hypothetical protein